MLTSILRVLPITLAIQQASASMPSWLPKAPPLAAPTRNIIRVGSAEQLLKSAEGAAPGTTILLQEGTYQLPRTLVLTGKQGIAIRSATGDPATVTLKGSGWEGGERGGDLIHIGKCDGVTIADITLADCRSYGIKVEAENGPRNVHIYNVRFRDIGVRAIKGSAGTDPAVGAENGSVRFCYFENTKVPPGDWLFSGDYIGGIDMMALEDWTFSDNVFRNVRGRNGGGRAAIFIWVRSRKVVVERNVIIDCDRGIAFGNPGQSTANLPGERLAYVSDGIIRNNFVVGGADCGIELWHSEHLKIFNNSIWRPRQNWGRGIRVGAGIANAEIFNNLVHGEVSVEGGNAELRTNLTGNLWAYFMIPASVPQPFGP